MKAISLWQPWASFCVMPRPGEAAPFKTFETRSWPFPPRLEGERILIHAAKRWSAEQQDLYRRISRLYLDAGHLLGYDVPLGRIVGSVVVGRCRPVEAIRDAIDDVERALGDYSDGRYAVEFLRQHRFFNPIPFPGRQKFFEVPESVYPGLPAIHTSN